jgi:hypothetical protein
MNKFPNDVDLMKNNKVLHTLRRSNVTLIIKFWYSYIYVQYKEMIDNLDNAFIFTNFLGNKNMTDVFIILSHIGILLQQLPTDDVSHFMKDILKISKLSELYNNS